MRILIATGIFEPETGGPAMYAPALAARLAGAGNEVTVVTFSKASSDAGDSERAYRVVRVARGNKLLNRIRFFFAVFPRVREADVVYMLDWFAAGLPTALAAKILGKAYIVRVGGDYLWEQRYLESGKPPMSLSDFYDTGEYKKYPILFWIIRRVLQGASHIVFNSDRQRELYARFYRIAPERLSTIYNPVPRAEIAGMRRGAPSHEFAFWGRFIVMKNLETLIRAFGKARVPPSYTLVLIGDGPQKQKLRGLVAALGLEKRVTILGSMPRKAALERVKDCRAFVLPSWTDISPNQVYEALALGLPSLVTKENYLSIRELLPEMLDPHSVEDVAAKLEMLARDSAYADLSRRFCAIRFEHDWDDVVREHLALFKNVSR